MDTDSIRATKEIWTRACLDRDWDALLSLCADDVVFAPPGEHALSGENLRPWLETFPRLLAFEIVFDRVDIDGSQAVVTGSGSWTIDVDGNRTDATFKFMDRLVRAADGWRYAHVIWNMNQPWTAI